MNPPIPIQSNEDDNDDLPVGRVLNRREMLAWLGAASTATILGLGFTKLAAVQAVGTPTPTATAGATATSIPTCAAAPALTEGPYFVDEMLNRSDIRVELSNGSMKEGAQLDLTFRVSDISNKMCSPLAGAQVDIWHCDAFGLYSDVADRNGNTQGQTFLRGYQLTDKSGVAKFTTIYPGWYSGRTVHIHFKIRVNSDAVDGFDYEFTSQLFFPDELSSEVYKQAPYASRGNPDTPNVRDNIFQDSDGLLTLNVQKDVQGIYAATFDIGLDLANPVNAAGTGNNGGGNRPPRR